MSHVSYDDIHESCLCHVASQSESCLLWRQNMLERIRQNYHCLSNQSHTPTLITEITMASQSESCLLSINLGVDVLRLRVNFDWLIKMASQSESCLLWNSCCCNTKHTRKAREKRNRHTVSHVSYDDVHESCLLWWHIWVMSRDARGFVRTLAVDWINHRDIGLQSSLK